MPCLIFLWEMEGHPRGEVGRGEEEIRGWLGLMLDQKKRGGWLGFDPRRKLGQGWDPIRPKAEIELYDMLGGHFGLWNLIIRR